MRCVVSYLIDKEMSSVGKGASRVMSSIHDQHNYDEASENKKCIWTAALDKNYNVISNVQYLLEATMVLKTLLSINFSEAGLKNF